MSILKRLKFKEEHFYQWIHRIDTEKTIPNLSQNLVFMFIENILIAKANILTLRYFIVSGNICNFSRNEDIYEPY